MGLNNPQTRCCIKNGKNKMKKAIFLTALMLLGGLTIILILQSTQEINLRPEQSVSLQTASLFDKNSDKQDTVNAEKIALNYQQCSNVLNDYRMANKRIGSNTNWNDLLDEGYTLDEITLAIEHFRSNYAASKWRTTQLKKNSDLSQLNQILDETVATELPELPSFIKMKVQIPSPEMAEVQAASSERALELVSAHTFLIDDVAWLMQQEAISQTLVLIAVSKLTDINSLLGMDSKHIGALHLIDIAALYGHDNVVLALLDKGSELSKDEYLPTTMDYALARLDRVANVDKDNGAIEKQLNVIRALQARNITASIESPERGSIKGNYNGLLFYHFSQQQTENIAAQYQVELNNIERRLPLPAERAANLISKLKRQFQQNLELKFPSSKVKTCQALIKTVQNQWRPKPLEYYINQLKETGREVTLANLNQIDPTLADCFSPPKRLKATQLEHTFEDSFIQKIKQINLATALTLIDSEKLEPSAKRRLFYTIIGLSPLYFQELQQSYLRQDKFDYLSFQFKVNFLRTRYLRLEASGFDITRADINGKTLVYAAVKNNNIGLLEYLIDQGVPYHLAEYGKDPLYLALDSYQPKFNPDTVMTTLTQLMRLKPPIQHFHKKQLALIKLKYPNLYQTISNAFSVLKIDESTPLPPASCIVI